MVIRLTGADFAAYFAFMFVLGFLGPSSTAGEVFNNWENAAGWPNGGTAVLVGVYRHDSVKLRTTLTAAGTIAPITTLTSADSICHLAEELKDASKWLPRIMVAAAATNFTIGFALLILILYRAGDIQAAIESPTGQPYIAILLDCTKSVSGTAILVVYMAFALLFCATNVVTTSSRQLFSFGKSLSQADFVIT
jgi:choline transport protein